MYDSPSSSDLTLAGTSGTTIHNVADGQVDSDAATYGQVQRSGTQATAAAATYTDAKLRDFSSTLAVEADRFRYEMRTELKRQDRRIDRQGAMSSAMLNMASSTGGLNGANRLGVGIGFQGAQQALAVGYQRTLSPRAAFSLGGAFADGESSAGVGFGLGW